MRTSSVILCAAIGTLVATRAGAATVFFHEPQIRSPTVVELSDPAEPVPPGSLIVNFFLTSDADILSIGFVRVEGGPLYNHSAGSNGARPSNALIAAIPPLGADSWIRLAPTGAATILGVDLPGDGTDNSTWGDTVNTPPSSLVNFNFAQLTILSGSPIFRFSCQVVVSGATGPEAFGFYPDPEPGASLLAICGLLGLTALRRRR